MSGKEPITLDVAIVGGGFAGVYCAKSLLRFGKARDGLKVGLISNDNIMVFQPMLPEVAGSSITPAHTVNPLRLLCRGCRILKGNVETIDWNQRELTVSAGPFVGQIGVRFKHLVLTVGASIDLSRIPGMPEHAFLMQNVGDAMLLRSTVISRIEEANIETRAEYRRRLLSFVVVGGGYSGVETAGQLVDLFRSIHRYYPNIPADELRVHLVHSHDHILPTLSRPLGEYTARHLQKRGLNLVLNQRVKAVTASRVCLADGSAIETNTVVCTVGNAPNPLVTRFAEEIGADTERGRIKTDPCGRVPGFDNLWAAGDCAAVPFVKGDFCPPTAQFGFRQGRLVGKNILRSHRKQPPKPFNFKGQGELASIGHRAAVANIYGLNFSGVFAWWMWRSIYLLKLPRLDRKVRVLLDWTLDLFFPRDTNLISPRFSSTLKEIYLEPGDELFHSGEPAFSLYIVKKGRMEIYDENGIVKVVTPGEYFGERALLQDGIWRFNAKAIDSSLLVSVPASVFEQLVGGSGTLSQLFRKSASQYESREVMDKIIEQMPPEVQGKTAADLMRTNLETLSPDTTVDDALAVIRDHPHSSYPVRDGNGKLLGVLRRDDFYDLIKQEGMSPTSPLGDSAITQLPHVRPDVSMNEVAETIVRSGANKLLVVAEDGSLAGIITVMDLITANQLSRSES